MFLLSLLLLKKKSVIPSKSKAVKYIIALFPRIRRRRSLSMSVIHIVSNSSGTLFEFVAGQRRRHVKLLTVQSNEHWFLKV